ncbi:hypothetical protein ACFQ9Q_11785 [Streptomyces virginiae]|uniref:hypothetical protein n=1 Tax=Streptomyces virginiae TaxID=1961 RepID=UPI0036B2ACD2
MPFNYVTVTTSSDLFAPATRAFGDILVVGKGAFGGTSSEPRSFSYPSEAVAAYPPGSSALTEDVASGVSAIKTRVQFAAGTALAIGKDNAVDVRKVSTVSAPAEGVYTHTLDNALGTAHRTGDAVIAQGTSDLAAAISMAFRQKPPPTRVWGLEVAHDSPDWRGALTTAEDLPVQIVVLANTPLGNPESQAVDNPQGQTGGGAGPGQQDTDGKGEDRPEDEYDDAGDEDEDEGEGADADAGAGAGGEEAPAKSPVALLAVHVDTVSNTGGDGKERIGVAMLDSTLTAQEQAELNTGDVHTDRMVLIAHKSSTDDVAAAVAGVIAGYEPHVSLLLKPLSISMPGTFTATEIDAFVAKSVNWVASPTMLPGHGLYLGEGLTASESGNRKYIDIVRTLDDISFRVKAALIQAVGDLRIDRPGLRTIVTLVQTVLSPLVTRGVLEDYAIHIPLLVLLERERATLNAVDIQKISDGRAARSVEMEVSVVYTGVIHKIAVKLELKG